MARGDTFDDIGSIRTTGTEPRMTSRFLQVHRSTRIGLAAVFLAGSSVHATPARAADAPLERWTVGGDGGWDYLTVDSAGHRLFMSRGTRVDVVDTGTGNVSGSIANTNGVHGIALAEAANRGYTSNGKADSVTMFDLASLQVIKEAPVPGHNPDAILYEPGGKHVFTFNGKSKDVSVLDADTLAVVGAIAVPDKPEFAVEDGAGRIFVNIESDPGRLVEIDGQKLAIKATWPLPDCASPTGLAIDKLRHRLFSVCDGGVMAVTDATTGAHIATVKIGEGPDAAAYEPVRGLVFSSNGEGTLTVVRQESADRYRVAETLPTQRGARTMARDPASGRVYLVTSDFDPAPAPTAETPHPRPIPRAGTFTVLVVCPLCSVPAVREATLAPRL
jgi:YVTN family beta-propeller protein